MMPSRSSSTARGALALAGLLAALTCAGLAHAQDAGTGDDPSGDGAAAKTAPPGEAPDPAAVVPAEIDAPAQETPRGDTYHRLREIGNQVDVLKEDTFATKSRLLLLRESVLRRSIAGSTVVVAHQNDMGSEYQLVQVLYALDREPKFDRLDYSGKLDDDTRFVVAEDKVVPGSHILMVQMVFRGNGWGIFRYMDGYTFTVKSSYAFNAEEGKAHEIVVRAFEQGGFFTPLEKRPTVAFEMTAFDLEELAGQGQAKASAP